MTEPLAPRHERAFDDRGDAMAEFIRAAGDAPRLLPADDRLGCPLFNAIAALQWTGETGLLRPDDRLHAVWFLGETGATVIERLVDGKLTFRYLGPQMETRQREPSDGTRSLDEPFVRGYDFTERWSAVAHFLATTLGNGALVSMLSARAPQVEHIRRWLMELFQGPLPDGADHVHALWTSTTGAGFLFPPTEFADGRRRGWVYVELGNSRED